ncbi:MAG: aminotransferase class III-fold pyridoxal phosphate-dependent enzyme [Actinobacteria bacterium]|nr:aminotransferase class III-fold pyridoxal phosphate-dependent enzyme [Actinomycetota bacterium]
MLSPLLTQATSVVAVKGEGAYLYGSDGQRYLDFTSGIGVTSTGHCHPKVVAAAQAQAATLIHGQYTTVLHPRLVELSERLETVMPAGIDTFFYANAGTEAVEASLRLVRQATGRPNVIVFQGGFHGRTMGSLSMTTSKTALRAGLQPLMGGVFVTPFPYSFRYGWDEETTVRFCLRELDHLLATQTAPDETAAVYLEPVLGEGGYVPATAEFVQGVRERCDAHGMLLVVDEIQTGVGRTGRFWGHQHLDVTPDVVITAKGLASGFPLSAFGAPRALMERGRMGSQGGTYGGNAVACAAALATLDVVRDEGLVERAAARGEQLLARLDSAVGQHPAVGELRGLGLMVGIELVDGDGQPGTKLAANVLRHACEHGLLLLSCGAHGQVVRFIPPLVVAEEQIDDAVGVFAEALEKAVAQP